MLLSIQSFSGIAVSLIVDRFYKRISLRAGITCSTLILTAAYLLYSIASDYLTFCVGAALSGVSYALSGTTAAAYLINTWFQDKRSFAMGIATSSTGLASVVAPQILAPIIENVSLTAAFLVEMGFILICALFLFVVVRKGPYSMAGKAPSTEKTAPTEENTKGNTLFIFTGRRAVLFAVGLFLCGFVVQGNTAALTLILAESFSGTVRAHLISIFGFAVIGGKLLCGRLCDRIGTYRTNYIFYSFMTIGLILVCIADSFALGLLAVIFLGLGSPFATVSLPAYMSDFARGENFPKALKYGQLTMTFARMIFTTVAGTSADLFGSYVPLFGFMAFLTPIVALLIQSTYCKCGLTGKRK